MKLNVDVKYLIVSGSVLFFSLEVSSMAYINSFHEKIKVRIAELAMAGYVLARTDFKGKKIIFMLLISSMLIPSNAMVQPVYFVINKLGLYDTKAGLILIYTGFGMALSLFLMKNFFMSVPKELEEAAKIDGCSYPGIFWEIIIKNSKPALMTLVIFTFMNTWNDFLRPLIFINDQENWTLSMGLAKFQGTYVTQWNQMMAGALITMLPILVVYIFAQKYFVQGIVMSGIKD